MKKITAIIFVLFSACATTQTQQPPQQCPTCKECPGVPESMTITGNGNKTELTLTREEFLSMYRLAKNYVALRDSLANATTDKNVTVQKIDNDRYSVTIKLDEKMSITTIVRVDNEELNHLRQQMRKITTEKPSVNVERLGGSKFKITMWVDDVKFSSVIDIEEDSALDMIKYLKGFLAGASFMALLTKYGVIKFAIIPLL